MPFRLVHVPPVLVRAPHIPASMACRSESGHVRHSYATAALAAGERVEVVSRRLGHANVSVTLNIYAHVTGADDEATADRVAARILSG